MGRQRREEILSQIQRSGFVSVRQLMEQYGVDASTVRRDLDALAKMGMVERSHGGASIAFQPAEVPYNEKIETQIPQKRAIARRLAQVLTHGQSLMLDSGSTALEVARALRLHTGLTVVTNDLRVANEMAHQGDVRLIVIGGELLPDVFTLMSERAVDTFGAYHVDVAVLGADAIDSHGVTNVNSFEVPMKRAMIAAADRIIVAADSSKFGQRALVRVAGLDEIDLVVTDDGLDAELAAALPVEIIREPLGSHL